MNTELMEQKEFKLADNVIIKCYDGEHTAIITKVYQNYIGGETWYQLYYEDVCLMTDSDGMRLAPEITMVLRKGA